MEPLLVCFVNFYNQIPGWAFKILEEIIISAIGGFVGGALVYGIYITYKEKKKDEYSKKSNCTKILLTTQTVLMFQMQELVGLKKMCDEILSCKLNNSTLRDLLINKDTISSKIEALYNYFNKDMENRSAIIKKTTTFIYTKPSDRHIINLPYDIFEIKNFKLKSEAISLGEITVYFQELSSCNRKYMEIISLIEQRNETRGILIQNLIGQQHNHQEELYISLVAGTADMSFNLSNKVKILMTEIEKIFTQTGKYIEILGLSETIQPSRNYDGQITFYKKDNL